MIHQTIGRGLLRFTREEFTPRVVEITSHLAEVLKLLLPQSPQTAIDIAANEFVDKSINLKKAMVEEHTLYHCFWIDSGDEFQETRVEVTDEEPTGRVLICTFPGLARTIKEDKELSEVIVVKASATLESVRK